MIFNLHPTKKIEQKIDSYLSSLNATAGIKDPEILINMSTPTFFKEKYRPDFEKKLKKRFEEKVQIQWQFFQVKKETKKEHNANISITIKK
ncbi:hypothetical protein [Chitinophaga sp.]|uniref:hypothetical protein n=1 Tax=Chitinophaga sp. TaxID=1869181 RepID=UPI0031CEC05F